MRVVGLTGNIGSGKSTIAGIFKTLNVPVYHADLESRKFLEEKSIIDEIVFQFGKKILTPDNRIDRRAVAEIVFTDKHSLDWLNSLMHPKVMAHFRSWVEQQQAPYVIQEAAIIYEAGISSEFDNIIYISCPKEIALSRVVARDGVNTQDVLQRMQNQFPDEAKSKLADYWIINDGSELVIPQVLAINQKLMKLQGKKNS